MDYKYIAPPQNANDGWMGHHVKLFVDVDKREDFWAFLENYCGPRGEQWRLSKKQERWIWGDSPVELRFRHKKHAMVVKLQWEEDEDPMERIYAQMKALTSKYTFPMSQMQARGLRNVNVTSIKPRANPTPWYSSNSLYPHIVDYSSLLSRQTVMQHLGLSGKDFDSIMIDECSETPNKPVWHMDKLRARGDTIMTTAMLEARLANSTSLPVLYEVRPDEPSESGSDRTSG